MYFGKAFPLFQGKEEFADTSLFLLATNESIIAIRATAARQRRQGKMLCALGTGEECLGADGISP